MTVTPDKFRNDLKLLKMAGYTSIKPVDLVRFQEGKGSLPDKPVMITLDDGYLSAYQYAYPILKKSNTRATMCIIGVLVGYDKFGLNAPIKQHFSWKQAREMYGSGLVDIEMHSYNMHNPGDRSNNTESGVLPGQGENSRDYEKRFKEDTQRIKDLIAKNVGSNPILYSYPYGLYNQDTEQILQELGVKITVTTDPGIASIQDGLFGLERIDVMQYSPVIDAIRQFHLTE